MINKLGKIGFALLFMLALAGSFSKPASAQEMLDGIVAVVGDEAILKSDVDNQAMLYAYQNQINLNTPGLWKEVFTALINQKILLMKAKLDSITVSSEEVDGLVEQRIAFLRERLRTDEAIVETFGKSIDMLRVDLREEIKSQRLVEELQRQHFSDLTVSNEEVVDFYNTYRDSLPEIPAEVEVAHIVIKPKTDSLSKQSALDAIQEVQKELQDGKDFAELARAESQDPGSARLGGDLGFVKRGEFVRRFEEVAFGLKENQISGIVETEFGYHIIQLLERKGEAIRVRHILKRFDKTKLNDAAAIDQLNEIRENVLSGKAEFSMMARQFSEDESSAELGGDIVSPQTNQKRIPLDGLLPAIRSIIETLRPGEISKPTRIQLGDEYAFSIVKLKYFAPKHRLNLEQDYARLRNMALQRQQAERYSSWVEELKKTIYWKVKI
ncbi:SurA domain [Chloroherpeton thalassium ATCC 35110]|uniref:SurA domain n=1 Tax=Chloroherpeton thalassium (strain ATCC 35110 / GB-78) TaxID=517418 RepID=B3QTY4_CHLT3|nr:peptidylprolyl isomerase [Chloroherpeton thalassium]ACF12782.1 SurA domain [Chloroherpeton thalassium ATCC 35110]